MFGVFKLMKCVLEDSGDELNIDLHNVLSLHRHYKLGILIVGSYVMQGAPFTQGTIPSISIGGSKSPKGFLPSILLLVLPFPLILLGVIHDEGLPEFLGILVGAYAFHQNKASLVRVPVANVTLSSSIHLLRENTDSVRSNQWMRCSLGSCIFGIVRFAHGLQALCFRVLTEKNVQMMEIMMKERDKLENNKMTILRFPDRVSDDAWIFSMICLRSEILYEDKVHLNNSRYLRLVCQDVSDTSYLNIFLFQIPEEVKEEDGEWIRFLCGNSSSGTKKYRGLNSSDGGNTGDGVKIASGVIGSGDEIGEITDGIILEFFEELKEMLPDKAGK
ncbi:hypothetical protein Tco_0990323 [Tanacetum coccineum]|uniref:Uncharacterized protein n=1 Tax=Tanacetum coccineum TaxID=301880 RepID=A0ABQ5EWT2_9ASTR